MIRSVSVLIIQVQLARDMKLARAGSLRAIRTSLGRPQIDRHIQRDKREFFCCIYEFILAQVFDIKHCLKNSMILKQTLTREIFSELYCDGLT